MAVGSPTPAEGWELWASTWLDLIWLPRCDNWHDPSLHAASPEAGGPTGPPDANRNGVVWRWFRRVTPSFGAWACRALKRAGTQAVPQADGIPVAFYRLREYLESRFPGCWPGVERASLQKVRLTEIPPTFVELARFGLFPRWDGIERDLGPKAEPTPPPEPPKKPAKLPDPKPARKPRRPVGTGPALFDAGSAPAH